jgi:hypothetical protein
MRQASLVTVVFVVTAKGRGGSRLRRGVALIALTAFVGSVAWLLFLLPVYVGFAVSVGSAIGWCVWLERHPDPRSLDLDEPGRLLSSENMATPSQAASGSSRDSTRTRRRSRAVL